MQENKSGTEPAEVLTTRHRARRLQQVPDTGNAAQRSSRKPIGRRKLENSPISGLIEHAGMIRLNANVPEENVPPPGLLTVRPRLPKALQRPQQFRFNGCACFSQNSVSADEGKSSCTGWLQEVRKAQQDVRNEHMLSNLRAEIMEVQEDVRRESASDVSSAHSPTELSSTSTSRYQVCIHFSQQCMMSWLCWSRCTGLLSSRKQPQPLQEMSKQMEAGKMTTPSSFEQFCDPCR